MRMKILGAVALAASFALVGCSGDGGSSSSSTTGTNGTPTSTSTGSNGTSTTGSNGTSSNPATTGSNGTSSNPATTGSNGTSSNPSTSGSTGTSSNPSTSGSTGTSSSAGTNASTSTSGSGGSSGGPVSTCSSNADCTNPGENCLGVDNGQTTYNVCGCTPDLDGSQGPETDSCAGNTDGNTVCDGFTLHCRGPRTYEDANPFLDDGGGFDQACDTTSQFAFSPIGFCSTAIATDGGGCIANPDGGSNSEELCMALCEDDDWCTAGTKCRIDDPLYYTDNDGGFSDTPGTGFVPISFCDVNVCGPQGVESGGSNADFFTACDAHGTGDGTCTPVLADTDVGLCSASNSNAHDGSACDYDAFNAAIEDSCGPNQICLLYSDTAPPLETGLCLDMCNASADTSVYNQPCPTGSGTCEPLDGDLPDGGFDPSAAGTLAAGFCY